VSQRRESRADLDTVSQRRKSQAKPTLSSASKEQHDAECSTNRN